MESTDEPASAELFESKMIEQFLNELQHEPDFANLLSEHIKLSKDILEQIPDEKTKDLVIDMSDSHNNVAQKEIEKAYHAGALDIVKLLKYYGVL